MALTPGGLMIIEAGDGQSSRLVTISKEHFPSARIETANDLKGISRGVVVDLLEK